MTETPLTAEATNTDRETWPRDEPSPSPIDVFVLTKKLGELADNIDATVARTATDIAEGSFGEIEAMREAATALTNQADKIRALEIERKWFRERLSRADGIEAANKEYQTEINTLREERDRLREVLAYIAKLKPSPIGDSGFSVGPQALLDAAQREARAALSVSKGT